jgi:hypothetical protein
MTTCKPSFIQLCFGILSSKTTLFKVFFHISFLCIGSCKINNHSGFYSFPLSFRILSSETTTFETICHLHCFAIWSSCKMNKNMEGYFSFTIGIWWNL